MTLRLVEHYTSPQGEGPRTGEITQFVRFAGCNMRCPGWPCDTQHAIQPSIWRANSYKRTAEELTEDIFKEFNKYGARNVCLTGGEPFLQPNSDLRVLIKNLRDYGITVEAFSNGSFEYAPWAIELVNFVMDWKLAGSGEANTELETRWLNAKRLGPSDCVKFVCKDRDDLEEAVDVYQQFLSNYVLAQVWVGAAWDELEPAEIVDFVKQRKLPWRLNVQVHKYIYSPDKQGV